MSALLASKVVVVEEEPTVRGIPSAPTSVLGAVGVAERGPIGQAVLCSSWDDYQSVFGGFTPDADLALAALGFFTNGGGQLWAVRTIHYTNPADAATATALRASGYLLAGAGPAPAVVTATLPGPYAVADGARIALALNGVADLATVVFRGSPAAVTAGHAGPYALADGQTLNVRIDDGPEQSVVFAAADFANIAAATAGEVAAAVNAAIIGGRATASGGSARVASDTSGTLSRVQVTGGNANAALAFPTTASVGGGNVRTLRAVSTSEIQTLVAGALSATVRAGAAPGDLLQLQTVATGIAASIKVDPSTASAFGFDAAVHTGAPSGAGNGVLVEGKDPGGYANRIEVEVRASASGPPGAFDLLVGDDGVYRETFLGLSMRPAAPRYIERVINDAASGSRYIRVTDQKLPDAPVPPTQTIPLRGGSDGLAGLTDADFVGMENAKTGLHALDAVQDLSLVIVPGRGTPAVHQAMLAYCEVTRDGEVFAILDPPAQQTAAGMVAYVASAALEGASEHAAIYWPRLKILNPAKSVFGARDQIVIAPSGAIAGVYARIDAARPGGVYDSPAGIDNGRLLGVLGFETDEVLEERRRDLVYPHRINPLSSGPGLPRFIDGSRTLRGDGNFPFIGERRGVLFIERSLKAGVQFARHKNNTANLRAQVRRSIVSFLLTQMANDAFRSRDPAKAFFVDVSEQLNTPAVIFAGRLLARVGVATNKPAEYVVISISQDTRALDAELATANG